MFLIGEHGGSDPAAGALPVAGTIYTLERVAEMGTAIANTNGTGERMAMVQIVKEQMGAITDLMREAMVANVDYGVIPGTGSKPTLLKPGAEKLCMLFKLSVKVETTARDYPGGHREYEVRVTLARRDNDGEFFGEGVGICSTLESKYRWRNAQRKCPSCGKAAIIKGKEEYGGGWVCFKKKDGCGAKYEDGDQEIEGQQAGKVENPDVADTLNTVLKMAKKRALVDAVLTATAASQIFTQDVEDLPHDGPEQHDAPPANKPASKPASAPKVSEDQVKKLVAMSGKTPDWGLAQRTVRAHFKVNDIRDLPASGFDEALAIMQRMVSAPNTPKPAKNQDADDEQEAALEASQAAGF